MSFLVTKKSCSIIDVTGSFINFSDESDNRGILQELDGGHDSDEQRAPLTSFQILNGSVVVNPSKAFISDSSKGESDSSLTEEDTYNR